MRGRMKDLQMGRGKLLTLTLSRRERETKNPPHHEKRRRKSNFYDREHSSGFGIARPTDGAVVRLFDGCGRAGAIGGGFGAFGADGGFDRDQRDRRAAILSAADELR